jgi:hypothetical protein
MKELMKYGFGLGGLSVAGFSMMPYLWISFWVMSAP